MTRSCPALTCPELALRHASPWRRKISATSSFGRDTACRSGRRRVFHVQAFERALDLSDYIQRNPRIARRCRDLAMAEQILDHPDVDALLQQMGREAMSQRVHADRGGEARRIH